MLAIVRSGDKQASLSACMHPAAPPIAIPLLAACLIVGCEKPSGIRMHGDLASGIPIIPFGESLHVRGSLWSGSDATFRRELSAGRGGFVWRISTGQPPVARLNPDRWIVGVRPGTARIFVSARGISADADVTVTWPLDSVEVRFVRPSIRVGDTVELVHRVHLRSGAVIQTGERFDFTTNTHRATAGAPDTILLVADSVGIAHARLVMLDRWKEDSIRIDPATAPPRAFRQPHPAGAHPRPTAIMCFTVATDRGASWLPTAIAFDSAALMPSSPGLGRRLDAARGAAMRGDRWWRRIGGDSVFVYMAAPRESPTDNAPQSLSARLGIGPRGLSGVTEDGARVSGRRISCAK